MSPAQRWQRLILAPCVALAAAAFLVSSGQAEVRRPGPPDQRLQLTQVQKQALFKARRDWELRSYPQRLALLKNAQLCAKDATSPDAYRTCKRQQHQLRKALRQQGRKRLNAERKRLGLPPLPDKRGRHSQRPWTGEN
ncbi:MAG: hypothetical protein ACON4T_02205 [Synechococcus sp.]